MNKTLFCLAFLFPQFASASGTSVDKAHSYFAALTHRSGIFGFVGHEHGISAARWTSKVIDKPENPSASSVEIVVEAPSLVVDSPDARRLVGLDPDGPGPEDRAKIQAKMLGPEVLDAEHYPEIRFKSSSAKPSSTGLTLEGALSLHGVTRQVSLPVDVKREKDGTAHFLGSLSFQMSDYKIDPPSSGGVVNVKDEMEIRFELVTR